MKYEEVKELSTQELTDRIAEEKGNLTRLKFSHAVSALENPLRIRQLKRDIARLNTELTRRRSAGEPAVAGSGAESPEKATN